MNEICSLNLTALADALQKKEISAEEATRACLDRIAATEERVGALLHVDAEGALARARQLDAQGPDASQPLWGVPVTVKDALSTQGMPTTAGSRILEGYMPVYDAFAVQRLREAGAVILGKNNLDEFAMGSTTENSAYKATHNPWDLQRVPGGSSGRGRLPVLRLPGLRYRRLHPSARQPLRLHRHQAHLRPRVPLRPHRLRLLPGPDRPPGAQRSRLRPRAGRHRRS